MREEVPLQAFVNGQTKVVPFFAKKNVILTAFKIQPPTSSEILLLYGCKKVRCERKCDNYRLSLL